MHFAHHESAYALTPTRGSGPVCTLEVLTASGKSCGAIYFDYPFGGGKCDSDYLNLGVEGTLVQALGASWSCNGNCACTWRWWSGYLR